MEYPLKIVTRCILAEQAASENTIARPPANCPHSRGCCSYTNTAASLTLDAVLSVQASIQRGLAALDKALQEKAMVYRSTYREGFGWVDFVWGGGRVLATLCAREHVAEASKVAWISEAQSREPPAIQQPKYLTKLSPIRFAMLCIESHHSRTALC